MEYQIKILVDGKILYEGTYLCDDPTDRNFGKLIFDGFDANRNVLEYDGVVGEIQKWYYGYVSHTPWCASSLSFFANRAGCLKAIGGKNDNVYEMAQACKKAAKEGYGDYYEGSAIPERVPQYAICFFVWSGDFKADNPKKHVCMAEFASSGDTLYCIGGNQSDKICTKEYSRDCLRAIYIIRKGDEK